MDSLTQFTLGAALGVATMGRTMGARRAAIVGGCLGTLPDLDVVLPAGDPIEAFVTHRGFSHAFFTHALITPLLGEGIRKLVPAARERPRWHVYGAVFAILVTHALLDALTTYGTRIFWPFSNEPVSISSIFIIDPLYTLPLLFVTVWALFRREVTQRLGKWVAGALIVTTGYLGWTLASQKIAEAKVLSALAAEGVQPERLTMIPMPFNSFVWRGLAIDGDRYVNVYRSVFDNGTDGVLHPHPRYTEVIRDLPDRTQIDRIADFSKGFYALERNGEGYYVKDLRMGVTPGYVFRFKIAEMRDGKAEMVAPEQLPREVDWSELDWLFGRIFDETLVRPNG